MPRHASAALSVTVVQDRERGAVGRGTSRGGAEVPRRQPCEATAALRIHWPRNRRLPPTTPFRSRIPPFFAHVCPGLQLSAEGPDFGKLLAAHDLLAFRSRQTLRLRNRRDADQPVLCMDEQPVQLHKETRKPIPATKNHARRVDYEYKRCGTACVFMFTEPVGSEFTGQHLFLQAACRV